MPFMHKAIFAAVLMLAVTATRMQAQVEFSTMQEQNGPDFHVDLVNTAVGPASHLSRLNVYLEIVYDELQFVKKEENFEATYEISVTIMDKDDDQADGEIWKELATATSFDMTNERTRLSQSHRHFDLEPGHYKVNIAVQDNETHRGSTRSLSIDLRDYQESTMRGSDILLVSEMQRDSTGAISIRPQVSDATKGIVDSTQAFFEVYCENPPQELTVSYELAGKITHKRLRRSFTHTLNSWRNPVYFKLHPDSLPQDSYLLTVQIESAGGKIKREKPVYIRWSALPATASDLKTAVEQLRLVASKDEWKRLKKAKGDALLTEFKAFWKRHDPSPGTDANETMDAFYSRVEFANQRFSVMQMPGWRTDMGVIFIILGSPDNVERDVYPRDMKPYEIWTYYEFNRDFLFLDYTGFGDYRLQTPMSIYEFQRLLHN